MPNISWWEILILVLVILLLFGPKRLPGIGRSMGRGVREFKETVTDQTKELKDAVGTTPREFKDGLNPFKDEKVEDAEVVAPGEAPPTPVTSPSAATAPEPEPVAAAPEPAPAEPQKTQ